MQFAVMVWVNSGDSAKMGTVFGVLDKSNPGALPILSPQGYWAEYRYVEESRIQICCRCKKGNRPTWILPVGRKRYNLRGVWRSA